MVELIRKDISAARPFLPVILLLFAVQSVGLASSPPVFIMVTLVFAALLTFGPIGIEETQGTEALWCSLPVSRRDVVLARYFTTLLGTVVALGFSWGVGRITLDWLSRRPVPSTFHLEPPALASSFLLISAAAALYLPCYFRWGAGKGLQMFSIVAFVFLVAGTGIGSLLVSVFDGLPGLDDLRDPEFIAAVGEWIDRCGSLLAVGLAVVALLGMSASAMLSARIYESRDC